MRVFNFSAGPSTLPTEVVKLAGQNIENYNGSGMSVMEMSHRSKWYDAINNECIALIRELMNVPDEYAIILVQGGASTQFEAVPLNLLKKGKADYIVTGNFAKKAFKEAGKYGDIKKVASSEDRNFTYIPKTKKVLPIRSLMCAKSYQKRIERDGANSGRGADYNASKI